MARAVPLKTTGISLVMILGNGSLLVPQVLAYVDSSQTVSRFKTRCLIKVDVVCNNFKLAGRSRGGGKGGAGRSEARAKTGA